jgi:hypothetical protein
MEHLRLPVLAVLIAGASVTSSCASPSGNSAADDPRAMVRKAEAEMREAGAIASADSIADGDVSMDDYYAAARLYQSCLRATGVDLKGPHLSPADNITLEWLMPTDVPSGADVPARVQLCTERWAPMIIAYEVTHEAVMDEPLRLAVAECLSALGHHIDPDARNIRGFVGPDDDSVTARLGDIERCVRDNALTLYPDLPGVTVIY